jgi:hypothetical protein
VPHIRAKTARRENDRRAGSASAMAGAEIAGGIALCLWQQRVD